MKRDLYEFLDMIADKKTAIKFYNYKILIML